MFRTYLFALLALSATLRMSGQNWEIISEKLIAGVNDTSFSNRTLNRRIGSMAVMPNTGDVFLVLNGDHPVYVSRDQGKSWKPVKGKNTVGRIYGGFGINIDPVTSRMIAFTIVQKKHWPTRGLILSGKKGKVLTEFSRPAKSHDGWTWGMAAWEQEVPRVILGKEHHAWIVMWLSKDGGKTWEKLDFTSRNPGVIDTNTFVAGKDDGIYRSADQGKTWEKVSGFITTGKNPVRYGKNYYWTTEKGLVVTRDRGETWELQGEPLEGALWGPYFGTSENSIMVVNREGYHITRDRGIHWEKVADFFVIPESNAGGKYNVMHPTNSYGWDEKRGIIYAAGLGGHAYKLKIR